jgi:FlaA1/EpsC-like NDP-sugar epimerase
MKINFKVYLAFIHDILAIIIAWFLSYYIRFNFSIPVFQKEVMIDILPFIIFFQSLLFFIVGLYKGMWRFASLPDLKRIILGAFLSFILLIAIKLITDFNENIPRSVIILFPIILVFILGGNRLIYRLYNEKNLYIEFFKSTSSKPILIIGAGSASISLAKELSMGNEYNVVGFLDEDQSIHNREINKIKILGGIEYLSQAVERFNISQIIVSIPMTQNILRKKVLLLASNLNLKVLIAPSADELVSGNLKISHLRDVDVSDLLGRNVVDLNTASLNKEFNKKNIFITGAGGSIGSELCKQIIKFKPKKIICFDLSEYALYQLEEYFKPEVHSVELIFLLGDIKNASRLNEVFLKYKPDIVFHTAAYKHVPLIENNNILAAFSNNVFGTYTLAKACKKNNVKKFILVSTDKAVNPTNIMGASKRLAEKICVGLQGQKGTNFITVRFGNVLDSSGSVIPKFRKQIESGGPITVTHPDITRFFMAIPEAAQLVMQSSTMGFGGEIFVLDMGEQVLINELAKNMIKLSGLNEEDIEIKFTGLRPGEKLYEEILIKGENILPTRHKKIFIAKTKNVSNKWVFSLMEWLDGLPLKNERTIKKELKNWVVEYIKQ